MILPFPYPRWYVEKRIAEERRTARAPVGHPRSGHFVSEEDLMKWYEQREAAKEVAALQDLIEQAATRRAALEGEYGLRRQRLIGEQAAKVADIGRMGTVEAARIGARATTRAARQSALGQIGVERARGQWQRELMQRLLAEERPPETGRSPRERIQKIVDKYRQMEGVNEWFPPTCPAGTVWDEEYGMCVPEGGLP